MKILAYSGLKFGDRKFLDLLFGKFRCLMIGNELHGIVKNQNFFELNEEIIILEEGGDYKYFIDSLILKRDEEVTSLFHFKIKLASCFVA